MTSPFPWKLEEYENNIAKQSHRVVDSIGADVCNNEPYYPHAVSKADMMLIAAAPDLLDALKDLLADTQHKDHYCGDAEWCPVIKARAAIAKATGEQP